ncbi:ABC transporter B family member [Trifolium repens]|nr:ABC transporter B family member [Trifolium repens]
MEEDGHDDNEMMKNVVRAVPFFKLLSYADYVDWILMGLGTLGSIVHGMALPVGYLLLGKALNAFGNNIHDINAMVPALKKVIPFVWYMAIATFPAGVLEIGCWMYASERQLSRLRLAYLKAVLNQEIGAFDTELTSGKVITGISKHMSVIQDAIGEKLGHFTSSCATFFAGIVIAAICCWEVALLCLVVVPLILIIGATYTKKMNKISTTKLFYHSEATSMIEQTISQIKTVYAFVGEGLAIKSFTENMESQYVISKGEALVKGVGTGMFQTVSFCSWSLIIWVGAVVVRAGRAKGGDIIAAVMSILFGAISITYAAPDMQIFNQAKAAGYEVFEVIQRKALIHNESKGEMPSKINGYIELRNVYFSYPSRPEKPILQGLSLSIPAGKTVALIGSSGCGKSTVISLITRFYDPMRGEIFIDSHNIKDLDLKFLRSNIGAVYQEPSLFTGTIKDNLKLGKMDADDEEIQKAAVMSNAHSFISQLPNQYLTEVGQRGVQVSGGQKQRIAIARAILKNPPILLLDEATSALDSESEKLVQEALDTAMQGRTVILIAHRLSTVVNADMIAVVENGQIVETGTHQSLLNTSKFYSTLFSMQNLESSPELRTTTSKNKIARQEASIDETRPLPDTQREVQRDLVEPSVLREQNKMNIREENIFFRIWFDLKKKELVKIAIGSFAAAFSGISKPFFGFYIITIGVAYFEEDAKRKVGMYSAIFSGIGLLSLFSHTFQHYFFGVVGEKAMSNFRLALYSGVLSNEVGWFDKPENTVGSLTSRIISDTAMVKIIIADRMSVIVQCVSSILIATVVSMYVNWRMGLVAWAVMPCHFIGGLIQAKSAKGFSGDYSATHSDLVALASESTTNIRTIASFCHEEQVLKKAKMYLDIPKKKYRKESIKYGIIQGFSLCLWNIAHAVALWYTTILVDRRQATFENGIRAYQIFSLTVPSITELYTLIPTVITAINMLTPAFKTFDRKTEIEPDIPDDSQPERIQGNVEFENVNFKYPLRPELSGGQKQRIAIARTLLKKPAILLLDEATSALDAESERTIVNAIKAMNLKEESGLCSRITQITVAHRLSTVRNSDTIIVMEKGRIVEMGSHSTLISVDAGLYSRLFRLQSFDETS